MAEEHTPTFAELLRRSRRAAGLSQEDLAERAGLSARAISALERGVNRSPRRDTLDMLADALDLSFEERQVWESVRRSQALRSSVKESKTRQRRAVAPLTNLPSNSTRFFGRDNELALLTSMLREPETRLVTLTGPGGSGKTRLALQVAGSTFTSVPSGPPDLSTQGPGLKEVVRRFGRRYGALGTVESLHSCSVEAVRHRENHQGIEHVEDWTKRHRDAVVRHDDQAEKQADGQGNPAAGQVERRHETACDHHCRCAGDARRQHRLGMKELVHVSSPALHWLHLSGSLVATAGFSRQV